MASDIVDRKYVSRFDQPTFSIGVYQAGVLTDADAPPAVSYVPDGSDTASWTRAATKTSTGVYEVTLSSVETATPGNATLQWEYDLASVDQIYALDLEIGANAPDYDALPPAWKSVVEQVWIKFADLYDSPFGGPNVQVYVQTHFGRNRLAQLLPSALQRLNSSSTPHQVFAFGGIDFPFSDWGGLLAQSLYIETLKHLIRSYVEQPEAVIGGASVSRLDRRDYMDRWRTVFDMETAEFERDLGRYRKAFMGLGNVSVLVSGGAYGNWGPDLDASGPGAGAARGYFYVGRYH